MILYVICKSYFYSLIFPAFFTTLPYYLSKQKIYILLSGHLMKEIKNIYLYNGDWAFFLNEKGNYLLQKILLLLDNIYTRFDDKFYFYDSQFMAKLQTS